MPKKYKKIPKFKSEKEEIKFWDTHDFIDYIDWSKAIKNPVFPNLKYSTKMISIRYSEDVLDKLKKFANEDDMPYQSLMKYIAGEYIRNREATPISVKETPVETPYYLGEPTHDNSTKQKYRRVKKETGVISTTFKN